MLPIILSKDYLKIQKIVPCSKLAYRILDQQSEDSYPYRTEFRGIWYAAFSYCILVPHQLFRYLGNPDSSHCGLKPPRSSRTSPPLSPSSRCGFKASSRFWGFYHLLSLYLSIFSMMYLNMFLFKWNTALVCVLFFCVFPSYITAHVQSSILRRTLLNDNYL